MKLKFWEASLRFFESQILRVILKIWDNTVDLQEDKPVTNRVQGRYCKLRPALKQGNKGP